jgi:phosphoserine aminotransferase
MTRAHNFGAGPAALPLSVLEEARRELLDWRGTGMSVMELSHRSPVYEGIQEEAERSLRQLLAIPESHAVLFLQGGASLQFTMVPLNLLRTGGSADYVLTGAWSKKAAAEARRQGTVRIAGSTEAESFRRIPRAEELDLDPGADYLHFTTNNTIFGTQWRREPAAPERVPLVADMSSDLLSRPVAIDRYGLIYAGAQKNLGPAGVTVVVVERDLLGRAPEGLATMLAYRAHAAERSMYNTPPTWAIYLLGRVCAWVAALGGAAAMAERNEQKAALLYQRIDRNDFYRGTAEPACRSRMNVTFRLADEGLERELLAEAERAGFVGLKGHRSVGGMRASLYNAVEPASVAALVDFLDDFERRRG